MTTTAAEVTTARETAKTARETAKAARAEAARVAKLAAEAAAAAKAAAADAPKVKTARDFTREIDALIIVAAGEIVTANCPEEMRDEVAALVAAQLHHLATKKTGWPEGKLPVPDRSDWK